MIISENRTINGKAFVRRASDSGMMIRREDGATFDEAYDLPGSSHVYEETDDPVASDDVTEADKDAALRSFGVEV